MEIISKLKNKVANIMPGSMGSLTKKEQDFVQSLSDRIVKYKSPGPDRKLDPSHSQAISEFIGDNGAMFMVKKNGKAYYSANFSYPGNASNAQLERIYARMAMIVREQIEQEDGELVESRSIKEDMENLIKDMRMQGAIE